MLRSRREGKRERENLQCRSQPVILFLPDSIVALACVILIRRDIRGRQQRYQEVYRCDIVFSVVRWVSHWMFRGIGDSRGDARHSAGVLVTCEGGANTDNVSLERANVINDRR